MAPYREPVGSAPSTVASYLDALADDRRRALTAVRRVIRARLPRGFVETVAWGMIAYEVPLSVFPSTYNGRPLLYAALASQKNYMSLYLMGIYGSEPLRARFEEAYAATGKPQDIGKSCVRFRTLEDLPLDVVGDAIGAMTLEEFVDLHRNGTSLRRRKAKQ